MRALVGAATALLLLLAGPALGRPMRLPGAVQSTISVNSDATLKAALVPANAGKIILVAPGNYDTISCPDFPNDHTVWAPAITVAAADAANPPLVSGIVINNGTTACGGIVFRGLKVQTAANSATFPQSILLSASRNVVLDSLEVVDVNQASPTFLGILVGSSNDVSIQNNRIHNIAGGLIASGPSTVGSGVNHLRVTHNVITDTAVNDFMQFEQVHDLLVDSNYLTRIFPGQDVHPDSVQVFAVHGPSDYITITNNTMVRGTGGVPQGIPFMGNESTSIFSATASGNTLTVNCGAGACDPIHVGDLLAGAGVPFGTYITAMPGDGTTSGNYTVSQSLSIATSTTLGTVRWPYYNVTVTGNQSYGSQNNGVTCGGCVNATVTGNTAQAYDDGFATNINRQMGYNVNYSGNFSTGFQDIVPQSTGTWGNSTPNLSTCHLCGPPQP